MKPRLTIVSLFFAAGIGLFLCPGVNFSVSASEPVEDFGQAIKMIGPSMVHVRKLVFHSEPKAQPPVLSHLDIGGYGTGIIVDKRGYILTGSHVIEEAGGIQALILNKEYLDAKLIGIDEEKGLALIKVDILPSWDLKPVKWSKEEVMVGDWVMKGGFPFAVQTTVVPTFARGIISNTRAFLKNYSTPFGVTDTPISEGDSGGPLFNEQGEVVGINAFVSVGEIPVPTTHFVPSHTILRVLSRLYHGNVRVGWLGFNPSNCIDLYELNRDGLLKKFAADFLKKYDAELPDISRFRGVMVMSIPKTDVGDAKFFHRGDVITHLNEKMPQDRRELIQWIAEVEPGAEIILRIIRRGEPMLVRLKVGEYIFKQDSSGNR